MKRLIATMLALVVLVSVSAVSALAASSPNSTATISFSLDTTTCQLTITSTKDISNFTVNGVKTEGVNTTSVTISVANGDVITVKSGTSTATFTVSGCGGGDDHDGGGDDHDGCDDHGLRSLIHH